MNIVDVVVVLLILMFGVIGFKRGVFEELVTTVGTIVELVLAFYLKNPLADFLSKNLPFFDFGGIFEGLTILNVVLYQLIAFLIVCALLHVVLRLIMKFTGVLEKILKYTIVLGIPSKILGAIVGFIEGFVIVFTILFFLNQPAFNLDIVKDASLTKPILNSTPLLSNIVGNFNTAFEKIYEVSNNYKETENKNQFNLDVTDILLRYEITGPDLISDLASSGKLKIVGIDSLVNQYR